jgi:DNA (cytosine-5)-methyltransferase 1
VTAYYNEIDPYAAQWLRNLIAAGHIAPGDVDERSIVDVRADDLAGYDQCHFFAGIGGWSRALRLAGWDDDRPVWTGSCPCQPFSSAGRRKGGADERHLWPDWFRLVRERAPAIIFGEQVARAIGSRWLDAVAHDLEGRLYAFGAAIVPACALRAPHRRDRIWFVANADGAEWRPDAASCGQVQRPHGLPQRQESPSGFECGGAALAHANGSGRPPRNGHLSPAGHGHPAPASRHDGHANGTRLAIGEGERSDPCQEQPAAIGADWWAVEPDVGRVAHGVSDRVDKLRAYGNAIVPQVAAEFIRAAADTL